MSAAQILVVIEELGSGPFTQYCLMMRHTINHAILRIIVLCTICCFAPSQILAQNSVVVPLQSDANNSMQDQNGAWLTKLSLENWFQEAHSFTDRKYLQSYFAQVAYVPPSNTYALIAQVKSNEQGVSLYYYSLGDSAFTYSMAAQGTENFWPASTIKLTAAIAALLKAKSLGINSRAIIRFNDLGQDITASLAELCTAAIVPSSNAAYNQLMLFAGRDECNEIYIRKMLALPTTILTRRYARARDEDNLRYSPPISYKQGNIEGSIPERYASMEYPQCPREANCTTLLELSDVLLRVVLHDELPESYRINLPAQDMELLKRALLKAPTCIGEGVHVALGAGATIYNKGGRVLGDDRLEIALVSAKNGTERYIIALSVPEHPLVESQTNDLARMLITAVQHSQSGH